jgi:hypothetical protein
MSTNSLSELQRQQLESVRSLFRGKSMVLHGGTWTAEAREPKRQQLLLTQLALAHELRQTMENAANAANQEGSTVEQATTSLLDQTSQMHQLTALTQAVQRQQVQESYDEYDKLAKDDRQIRNKKLDEAKAILRDQCERLADPKKERPRRIPIIEHEQEHAHVHAPPAEQPHVSVPHVPQEAMKTAAVSLHPPPRPLGGNERGSSVGSKKPAPPSTTSSPPTTTTTTVAPGLSPSPIPGQALESATDNFEVSRRPQKKNRLSLPTKRPAKPVFESPSPPATATTTPTYTKMKSKEINKPNNNNNLTIPPPEAAIHPDATHSLSPPVATAGSGSKSKKRKSSSPRRHSEPNYTAAVAAAAANSPTSITTGESNADARPDATGSALPTAPRLHLSRRTKRRDGPKKCHNCKTMQTEYLKCNYFLVTGNRCGKYYCSACLKDDYGEDVDVTAEHGDWQYVLYYIIVVSTHFVCRLKNNMSVSHPVSCSFFY